MASQCWCILCASWTQFREPRVKPCTSKSYLSIQTNHKQPSVWSYQYSMGLFSTWQVLSYRKHMWPHDELNFLNIIEAQKRNNIEIIYQGSWVRIQLCVLGNCVHNVVFDEKYLKWDGIAAFLHYFISYSEGMNILLCWNQKHTRYITTEGPGTLGAYQVPHFSAVCWNKIFSCW